MVVVALQKGLPVFGGNRLAIIVEKVQRPFDYQKYYGVFLADHPRRMRGTGDFEDDVTRLRDPALVVRPSALHGVNDDGPRMKMHLQRCTGRRTDEQNNLPGDGIQLDQLDGMSLGPGNPRQSLGVRMTRECFMDGLSANSVAHGP